MSDKMERPSQPGEPERTPVGRATALETNGSSSLESVHGNEKRVAGHRVSDADADGDVESRDASIDDSPYPEIRAVIPPIDQDDLPVNTFRAWCLAILSTIILSAILQFFQLHSPPIFLSAYIVILFTLPLGHFLARVLPTTVFNVFGLEFTLNPGPFNQKEHTLTAIMASLVTAFDNGSLASDVYVAFDKFLDIPVSTGYRFMFLLTTQALSFSFAGMFQRILVQPSFCIWPSSLPTCSILYGFHDQTFQNKVANGWKIHRMKFFWIVLVVAACWQVVPSFLFTSLTTFAWITWIKPNDITLNQVFGATTGMDLLPMTLDWNQVSSYLFSPLVVPSWALLNVVGGSIFFLWIISPALHWKNVWEGRYMPFSSSRTFDNTGAAYNTSRVMNPDYSLNEEAYKNYSPVFLSTTSVLSYGLGFASIASILVHTALFHRQVLVNAFKSTFKRGNDDGEVDVHGKLMRRYRQVPMWWYLIVFVVILSISMAFIYVYDTGLPWYGLLLSVAINLILLIPIGLMQATCNITINTGVLSALIAGSIWPGRVMNNVVFKVFTLVCTAQGLGYINNMKIAHYMKIPPRVTFAAQCTGILVSWVVQTAVNLWAMGNVRGICTTDAASSFTCPLARGYAANAVFWGLIGPRKLFQSGSMYRSMLWFFLIGAIVPVIIWGLSRRFPNNKVIRRIHAPIIFASTSTIPPATAANYLTWGAIGLIFNFYIKGKYRAWWSKYNYLLSAAMDSALAITTFLVFFCLSYPGVTLDWWGNNIAYMTADGQGLPLDTVAPGETFGPKEWI